MITGNHYNFVKKEFEFVTPDEANKLFFLQVLTGDSVDDIPGLKGIGPVKSKEILDGYDTIEEMAAQVVEAYASALAGKGKVTAKVKKQAQAQADLTSELIWIMRSENTPYSKWSW